MSLCRRRTAAEDETAVDARLSLTAGRNLPVTILILDLHFWDQPFIDLPAEDLPVEARCSLGILCLYLKMDYSVHAKCIIYALYLD